MNRGRGCVVILLSGISRWSNHWHTNREGRTAKGMWGLVSGHVLRKESSGSMAVLLCAKGGVAD